MPQTRNLGRQVADAYAQLCRRLTLDQMLTFDHRKEFQVQPLLSPVHTGQLLEGVVAAAGFQPAMALSPRFGDGVRRFLRCRLEPGEEVLGRGIRPARTPTGLAVYGDNLGTQCRRHAADPTSKGCVEFLLADQAEQSSNGVVRGNSVLKLQRASQPVQLLLCPQLDLNEDICPNQYRTDCHYQQFEPVALNK